MGAREPETAPPNPLPLSQVLLIVFTHHVLSLLLHKFFVPIESLAPSYRIIILQLNNSATLKP